MLVYLLFISTLASCLALSPQFSWDTPGGLSYLHLANASGPYTDEALDYITKFQVVTIEKWQQDLKDSYGNTENKIIEQLHAIKEKNANTTTLFYVNSYRVWTNGTSLSCVKDSLTKVSYPIAEEIVKKGLILKTENGTYAEESKYQLHVYDYTKQETQQLFKKICHDALESGYADGCFVDASDMVPGTPGDLVNLGISTKDQFQWLSNHETVLNELTLEAREKDSIILGCWPKANAPYLDAVFYEFFLPNAECLEWLQTAVKYRKMAVVHTNCTLGASCNNTLAAFLIGAGENSYLGWGDWNTASLENIEQRWWKEFDYPLGKPKFDAVLKNGVWEREFESGTTVQYDTKSNEGKIEWANKIIKQ